MAEVWFLAPDGDLRVARLVAQHERFGRDAAAARAWAVGPDDANARQIATGAPLANFVIPGGLDPSRLRKAWRRSSGFGWRCRRIHSGPGLEGGGSRERFGEPDEQVDKGEELGSIVTASAHDGKGEWWCTGQGDPVDPAR